jgi:uncharacterized phage-associated protein
MIITFLLWLLSRLFNGKNREKIEPCIKEFYRSMASEGNFKLENELPKSLVQESYRRIAFTDLKIKSQIIKVKKGTRRYDIVFLETAKGELKFNLGRHWETDTPMEKIIAN